MVLWLLPQTSSLSCPHSVHSQSYSRHVPGEESEEHHGQAAHVDHLLQAEKKSSRLRGGCQPSSSEEGQSEGKRNTDRTTRLLVVLLVLFLIAEVPQGVLGLLSAVHGKQFFLSCYNPLGELMDLLALFNGALNFIIYCSMSTMFRQTLTQMFDFKFSLL